MSKSKKYIKTQNEILDVAWDLISEKGADVSIAEIAKAAGLSRQSVYLHFGSRGNLLVALVRRADVRFDIKDEFFNSFKISGPQDRLEAAISVWLDFVPKIYPVAKDLIRLRATDEDASLAWEDRMEELKEWLLVLTTSLKDDNALQDHWTNKEASSFLWAGFSVQMWGLLVYECGWSEEKTRDHIRMSLVQSLLKSPFNGDN